MFPKNSPFSKDSGQAEYEANLRRRALSIPERPADDRYEQLHKELEDRLEEFRNAQSGEARSE